MKKFKACLLVLILIFLSLSCTGISTEGTPDSIEGSPDNYEGVEAGNPPKPKKIRGVAQLIPESGPYLYIADFIDDTSVTVIQADRNNGIPIPFNDEYLGETVEALNLSYQQNGDLITIEADFNLEPVKVLANITLANDNMISNLEMLLDDQSVESDYFDILGEPKLYVFADYYEVYNQCLDNDKPIHLTQDENQLLTFQGGFDYIDGDWIVEYYGTIDNEGYIQFTNEGQAGSAICEGHVINGVFSGSCVVDEIEICAFVYHT